MNIMNKEEARKELEFYKNLASNHEAIVKGCNEKIIELQAIINKPDRWQDGLVQPEKEEYYYLINRSDKGLVVSWNCESDRKPEYAFRTEEQAELIKEKMLLMQEMYAFAHVRNEGWVPNWEDDEQDKYGLSIGNNREIYSISYCSYNCFLFGIAVKSGEIAKGMLEEFGRRIERIYNKQY